MGMKGNDPTEEILRRRREPSPPRDFEPLQMNVTINWPMGVEQLDVLFRDLGEAIKSSGTGGEISELVTAIEAPKFDRGRLSGTTSLAEAVMSVAKAIESAFITPNESDRNFEAPGPTDGLYAISRSINKLASAIERLVPEGK